MNIGDILDKTNSVTYGHFVGTSGLHLPAYINKDLIISHPKYASEIGKLFAQKFKNKNIDVVVAPAVAGIALSGWVAYHLGKLDKKEILSLFTEKDQNNNQIFKRGYDKIVKNKKVLIIEDVTTKGSSVKKIIKAVKVAGGKIVAVGVMVNRDPELVNSRALGVPFFALKVLKIPSYKAKRCPMCKKGIRIDTQLGHGSKFLNKK